MPTTRVVTRPDIVAVDVYQEQQVYLSIYRNTMADRLCPVLL